jgi:hypothetical protein
MATKKKPIIPMVFMAVVGFLGQAQAQNVWSPDLLPQTEMIATTIRDKGYVCRRCLAVSYLEETHSGTAFAATCESNLGYLVILGPKRDIVKPLPKEDKKP